VFRLHGGDPAAAKLAPDGVLVATDVQTASLSARDGAASRFVSRPLQAGDPTTFTLPDPIGPVAFVVVCNELTATWSTLPAHDLLDLTLIATSSDLARFWVHDLELSERYLATTGATSATIETADLPGFRVDWQIDTTGEHRRVLSAVRTGASESASSTVAEAQGATRVTTHQLPAQLERLRQ